MALGRISAVAAAAVRHAQKAEFNLLERAVKVEGQSRKLARAKFIVDVHAGVDFFCAIAIRLKTHARFQQFDLCRQFSVFIRSFG